MQRIGFEPVTERKHDAPPLRTVLPESYRRVNRSPEKSRNRSPERSRYRPNEARQRLVERTHKRPLYPNEHFYFHADKKPKKASVTTVPTSPHATENTVTSAPATEASTVPESSNLQISVLYQESSEEETQGDMWKRQSPVRK